MRITRKAQRAQLQKADILETQAQIEPADKLKFVETSKPEWRVAHRFLGNARSASFF